MLMCAHTTVVVVERYAQVVNYYWKVPNLADRPDYLT